MWSVVCRVWSVVYTGSRVVYRVQMYSAVYSMAGLACRACKPRTKRQHKKKRVGNSKTWQQRAATYLSHVRSVTQGSKERMN